MNKNFDYNKLTPFKWFVLENFPFIEADFDAITDWQLFCKLGKKLNKIIDNMNTLGTQVESLTDFVSNYFDNLDVQEEIDNKLNEMAESGQLEEIIAEYLQMSGLLCYNTVNDMKNATNLINGSIAKTLGENSYNDGNGYFYKIRTITSGDVVDELNIVSLESNNTLIAERIYNNKIDKSNPIFYGADPTGTVDSSVAIQKCIDNNINSEIIFTPGKYLINNPIEISYQNKYGGINFNNSEIINNTELDYVIGIGTKNHDLLNPNSTDKENRIYNIRNLKMKSNSTYAILIDRWFMNVHFDNIDLFCYKNGIQIGKRYENYDNPPSDAFIENFIITCNIMNENYIGINIIGTDSKITNGRIYGFKTCILCNRNLVQINNVHFLATNFINNFDENYVAIKDVSTAYIDNCYCDSYPVFVKYVSGDSQVFVNNLFVFSWTKNMTNPRIFDFSSLNDNESGLATLHLNNIKVTVDSYPTDFIFLYYGLLGTTNQPNFRIISFIANSTFNDIDFTGAYNTPSIQFDISRAKNNQFVNNFYDSWKTNWLLVGYITITNNTSGILELTDRDLGTTKFLIETNSSGVITNVIRKYRDIEDYDYSIAFKQIDERCYKLYVTKNKQDLTTGTNSLQMVLLNNPFIKLMPATIEDFIYSPETSTNVDIISQ